MNEPATDALRAAYDLVKEWPDKRMACMGSFEGLCPGIVDLLALRNLIPDAIARLDAERAALATAKAKIDEIAAYAVQQGRVLAEQEARAETAEAKLATAQEALRRIAAGNLDGLAPHPRAIARAALDDTGGGEG